MAVPALPAAVVPSLVRRLSLAAVASLVIRALPQEETLLAARRRLRLPMERAERQPRLGLG